LYMIRPNPIFGTRSDKVQLAGQAPRHQAKSLGCPSTQMKKNTEISHAFFTVGTPRDHIRSLYSCLGRLKPEHPKVAW
jgi:hypothetical protein